MAKQTPENDRPETDAAPEAGDEVKAVTVTGDAPDEAPADPPADATGEAAPEPAEAEAAASAEGEAPAPKDAAQLEAEVADLNDKLLRALAEAENVRRRAARDKEDARKYAIADFAREMLGVADNLKRALESLDADGEEAGAGNADTAQLKVRFDRFVEGVQLTEAEMLKTFQRIGIEKIDPQGQPFDPNLHEAMFEIDDAEKPAGTVMQVLEPGYVLNDRLLRPAKVGVAKGGPKVPAEETEKPKAQDAQPKAAPKAYEDKGKGPGAKLDEEL